MIEADKNKLLVVAWDGATWDLLRPMVDAGRMPNLAKLMREGVSATLESSIPPISPTAWLTFATSKNPGYHGVFDFFRPIRSSYADLVPTTADSNHQETLWGMLSRLGRQVGVVNVPMTYPAEPVFGFLIPGAPMPAVSDPAYPPGLVTELKDLGWDLTQDATLVQGSFEDTLLRLQELVEARIEATCYLLRHKPWSFYMVHFLETDQVQHSFWRFLNNRDHPLRDSIPEFFEMMDAGLGRILACVPDASVILMSDHGMGPVNYHLSLNNWFIQEGFMRWKTRSATRIRRLAYALGLSPSNIYSLLPRQITRRMTLGQLRTGLAQMPVDHVGRQRSSMSQLVKWFLGRLFITVDDIDWSLTQAYSTGTTSVGLIYLNVRGREPNGIVSVGVEYEELCDRIAEKLQDFADPYTGRRLVKAVYRRDEVFHGPYIDEAPDLVVAYNHGEYDQKKGSVFLTMRPVQRVRDANATHRMEGVFVLHSPTRVCGGSELESVDIKDVVPTVLYLLDAPIPSDLEGKLITYAFSPDYLESHPVQIDESAPKVSRHRGDDVSPEELQDILERLHGLGYV